MTKRIKNIPDEHLRLEMIFKNEWQFECPRLTMEVLDEFYGALELSDLRKIEKVMESLTARYPEFIDAHHHNAMMKMELGHEMAAFEIWMNIVDVCLKKFPESFCFGKDRLVWGILENRPFLRAYHALGQEYYDYEEIDKAISIFKNILDLNPNDNQGIRGIYLECLFNQRRPGDIIEFLKIYPDDIMPETVYGKVLAFIRLGDFKHAEIALKKAIKKMPLVAKELVKKRHRAPEEQFPFGVNYFGADGAFYYWEVHGHHWKNTPGAVEFVKKILDKMP